MFNRASAAGWSLSPIGGAVAETIDRGFDWGAAAVGAGVGAAGSLLLVAFGAAVRARRTGVGGTARVGGRDPPLAPASRNAKGSGLDAGPDPAVRRRSKT